MPRITPIATYPDYGVSRDGRVWRITPTRAKAFRDRTIPYEIKPILIKSLGYHFVNLYSQDGKHTTEYIHKLMAETFLGERPHNHDVDHKNGNKTDNRLRNLRYLARDKHCHKHEAGRGDPKSRKLDRRQVRDILRKGLTASEIKRKYGVSYSTGWHIAHGVMWKHVWREFNPTQR